MSYKIKYFKLFCLLLLGLSITAISLRYICPIKKVTLYYGNLKSDNNLEDCYEDPPMITDKYFISHAESFSKIGMIRASSFYKNLCKAHGELEEITHIELPALDWSFLDLGVENNNSAVDTNIELVPMSDRFFRRYCVIVIQKWTGEEQIISLGSENQIKMGKKYYQIKEENSKKLFEIVKKYFKVNIIK